MPTESKVQKVARGSVKKPPKLEKCECGGTFAWVLFSPRMKAGKMIRMCDQCPKLKTAIK